MTDYVYGLLFVRLHPHSAPASLGSDFSIYGDAPHSINLASVREHCAATAARVSSFPTPTTCSIAICSPPPAGARALKSGRGVYGRMLRVLVAMPNHVHLILTPNDEDRLRRARAGSSALCRNPPPGSSADGLARCRFADLEGLGDPDATARLGQGESIGRPVGAPDFLSRIEARVAAPRKRGPKPAREGRSATGETLNAITVIYGAILQLSYF